MKECRECCREITDSEFKSNNGFCAKCYKEKEKEKAEEKQKIKENKNLPPKPVFSKGLIIYCIIAFAFFTFLFLIAQDEPQFGIWIFEILLFVLGPLCIYYFGSYKEDSENYYLAKNDYTAYKENEKKKNLELIRKNQLNKSKEIDYTMIVANDTKKSLGSSIMRGAVGGALLGPVGMLGGALSGKNKSETTFTIVYKDSSREVKTVSNDSLEFKQYAQYIK